MFNANNNTTKVAKGALFLATVLATLTGSASVSTWVGSLSTNWNDSGNWSPSGVPMEGSDIVISAAPFALSIPASGVIISNLSFSGKGSLNFSGAASLTVKGNASLNNSGQINLGSGQITFLKTVRLYSGGVFNAGSGLITMKGSVWQVDSGSTFNPQTSLFYYNGNTAQTNQGGFKSISYYDVVYGTTSARITNRINAVVHHAAVVENGAILGVGSKGFTPVGSFTGNGSVPIGKPYIVNTITPNLTTIDVTFSESLGTSANTASYFSITNTGYTVTSAARTSTNTSVVRLTISPALQAGSNYVLKVSRVKDATGTAIVPNTLKKFTAVSSAPVPVLTAITPTFAKSGDSLFSMTLTGSGFLPNSVVRFNGSPRLTTYVSPTQLKAVISENDLRQSGVFPITVYNFPPGGGTSQTQSFAVNYVNHAPTFELGPDQSILKNSGAQFVSGWVTGISSGVGDSDQSPLSFILSNDNPSLFSVQPSIVISGNQGSLIYTPAVDAIGTAVVSVQLHDSGGTANGGVDTSAVQTFLINIGVPSITEATGGSAISADTKASESFTSLTGPTYVEGSSGNVGSGTIVLQAPAGFEFDTNGTAPTVLISRVIGDAVSPSSNNINGVANGASVAITRRTVSQIVFTVTSPSSDGVACALKWQGVRVRPAAGTPLAEGNLTVSGTAMLQHVNSSTSFGTLTEIAGAAARLTVETQPSATAITDLEFSEQPEIGIADQFGNLCSEANGRSDDLTSVTVSRITGTGALKGTLTVLSADGIAEFNDLSFSNVSTNKLRFTASGLTSVTSSVVTVILSNRPPTLAAIDNLTVNEDSGVTTVNLTGMSVGTANEAGQTLVISASSSNPSLIPDPIITYTNPDAVGMLKFTPVSNGFGTARITVTVRDDGGTDNGGNDSITKAFQITVTSVNDVPTLNYLKDLVVDEDAETQTVDLTGISSGTENEVQTLAVTATSSNPALIPNPSVTYVSGNSNGTLQFTPVANAYGTAIIRVTVKDGISSITNSFAVTVNPIDDLPTLNALGNRMISEDAVPQTVSLSGITSGAPNENQKLTVTAFSSDPSLIPNPIVNYSSPNTAGTLAFAPVSRANGTATISVIVSDGAQTATATFIVTVLAIDNAPSMDAIANLTIDEDAGRQTVSLTGISSGAANEVQTITMSAVSCNPALIANPTVVYTSPSPLGHLNFSPVANANGNATIKVIVSDGRSSVTNKFIVAVSPVNDAPQLDSLNNLSVDEDSGEQAVILSGIGSGASDESQTLTVTASSSNPDLIPDPSINYASPGANGTLYFTPVADKFGEATISVVVNDGGLSTTQHFIVTVQAVNDAPTLSGLSDMRLLAGTTQSIVLSGISSGRSNENDHLTVVAYSSNPQVVAATVNFTSPDTTARLVLSAGDVSFDSATVVVSVFDGTASVSQSFSVSVGLYKASFDPLLLTAPGGPISAWLGNIRGTGASRDLVIANYLTGTISIRMCDDVGGFNIPKTIKVGGNPSGVFTGDLDNDKVDDIAVADFSTNQVAVVMNQRRGIYAPAARYAVGKTSNPGPSAIWMADITGDKRAEIFVANQLEGSVSVLRNNYSSFETTTYTLGGNPSCIALAELTGDKNSDIYVAAGDSVRILPGLGEGRFDSNNVRVVTPFPGGDPQITHALAADFNGDGRNEFAIANANSNTVSICLGQVDGSFLLADNYLVGVHPQHLLVRDVNHDGKADIVVANSGSDTLSVLISEGNGKFFRQLDIAAGESPVVVVGSNFNNDQSTDLAVLNYNTDQVTILVYDAPLAYPVKASVVEDSQVEIKLLGRALNSSLLKYKVVRAPAHGTLNVSGTFSNPTVVYTPAADYFGSDSFAYTVANDISESVPSDVSITVSGVNDAPSFLPGGDVVILKNSKGYTNVWAGNVSIGPANEAGQKPAFVVTTGAAKFFAAKPVVDSKGVLKFRVLPNVTGTAVVSVRLADNGGLKNGGQNSSVTRSFTVTVKP